MTSNQRHDSSTSRVPPSYHTMQQGYNQQGENEPLLGTNDAWPPPKRLRNSSKPDNFVIALIILSLILCVGIQTGYIYASRGAYNIYDPQERARIRRGWEVEYAEYTQNITRLITVQNTMRKDWEVEYADYTQNITRLIAEQKSERKALEVEHDRLLILREEIAREHQKREDERRQWEEDRRKRESEERERQRKLIRWGPVRKDAEPCLSYGTARYQASLDYSPPGWDTYSVCKETPVQFHRRDVHPTECHHVGTEMVGVWIIDFDEPSCKPWWRDTKDLGCTSRQSGIHRYEGHLEGYLEPGEYKNNWAEMCSTTPHTMFGQTHKSPDDCVYWGRIGVYGFWDVPDAHCR